MPTTVPFWVAITGWISTLVGGSLWMGKQHQRMNNMERLAEKCHLDELMTEAKCEKIYITRQTTNNVILKNIQKSIDGMAISIKEISENQHQRQVDFARMTEQMATLATRVGGLCNDYTMRNGDRDNGR